ncbi:hypothetical protein UFOVP116_53 [uncultured Caudovirales phage]|uniref:Uncharacterized protein n=1 Tax=uncultured Caudovirales phage TaxID=2100421 RepID=A0A6J5L5I7_9CAUD|nr:hypothetical protein UFOVP116_53 [uncultured Caudovirales phage]
MSILRKFIDIVSEAEDALKKTVIDMVNSTDDDKLLNKVLTALKAGNIDERIVSTVSKDPDASKFGKQIANVIVNMDFPIEEKDAFLAKFPKGVIDPAKLLDGSPHTFLDLVDGDNFTKELFKLLTTTLVSQGVGPGEVALAALHPNIAWSGRAAGGGDILVNNRAIEVKTSVASGGRWINPRKAKMNLPQVLSALSNATGIDKWPDRINASKWCSEILPAINEKNPDKLVATCSAIASSLFTSVDTSAYSDALKSGNLKTIIDEHLRTGFENYKAVSDFEGILLMDVRSESAQYFGDYDSMKGRIKSDAVYIYAPEGEIMPKVTLLAAAGGGSSTASASTPSSSKPSKDVAPVSPVAAPSDSPPVDNRPPAAKRASANKKPGVGRELR